MTIHGMYNMFLGSIYLLFTFFLGIGRAEGGGLTESPKGLVGEKLHLQVVYIFLIP